MKRHAVGIVAGLIAGFFCVVLIEAIASVLYPPPEDLNLSDRDALRAFIADLPPSAFLIVLAAHALGSVVAGAVYTLIAGQNSYLGGLIVGGVLFCAGILNLLAVPHPFWFAAIDIFMYVPAVFVGCLLAGKFLALRAKEPAT